MEVSFMKGYYLGVNENFSICLLKGWDFVGIDWGAVIFSSAWFNNQHDQLGEWILDQNKVLPKSSGSLRSSAFRNTEAKMIPFGG